jgi:hypothetical protein
LDEFSPNGRLLTFCTRFLNITEVAQDLYISYYFIIIYYVFILTKNGLGYFLVFHLVTLCISELTFMFVLCPVALSGRF